MFLRTRLALTAAVGLWLAPASPAEEPARFAPAGRLPVVLPQAVDNQSMAEAVAARLTNSGQLRHFAIDVVYQNGTAELHGTVANVAQRDEAVRIAKQTAGVAEVRDRLILPGNDRVLPAQARGPVPAESAPLPAQPGVSTDPIPAGAGPSAAFDFQPPRMPPYAWPTYAPYNNFSRVAYPEYYPYQSWPFIGPCNPFPKPPLGWRTVKLEWEDGHWWYSRVATSHDWWRIKYW